MENSISGGDLSSYRSSYDCTGSITKDNIYNGNILDSNTSPMTNQIKQSSSS